VAARHTEVDHQLALLDAVLGTVERMSAPQRDRLAAEVRVRVAGAPGGPAGGV
jgi:hypothetical protein